ncbi:tetratricopeptide repeat protein [Camelimonas abortus]|uniref:Tetratricopeptide repeat protein n=1 Tax=Camelimonas abortus TaxID=1017184 RepID=A0ABV7LD32_9HYPH
MPPLQELPRDAGAEPALRPPPSLRDGDFLSSRALAETLAGIVKPPRAPRAAAAPQAEAEADAAGRPAGEAAAAYAADGRETLRQPGVAVEPLAPAPVRFRSGREAFRAGIRAYNAGDIAGALQALEYAASRGHGPAQWKLGRMYAEGDGVPHDDLKAFEYFSRVVQEGDDGSRHAARFTSNAYVALGAYYLEGIPGTYVRKDPQRARELFLHAASYYGDPDAQYNLARLCLAGQGGPRDARLAARWLNLAAEKNHAPSQALLGHLLVTGQGNVARQTPRGLMWLTLARNQADPLKDGWIHELYDQALALASDSDRSAAQAYLESRGRK